VSELDPRFIVTGDYTVKVPAPDRNELADYLAAIAWRGGTILLEGGLRIEPEKLLQASALLRAPVQASEARGDWVLVPPHPTVEMMIEGQNADDMQHTTQTIAEIYKAMIAAHTQAGPVD
jgi:hypothetical protein